MKDIAFDLGKSIRSKLRANIWSILRVHLVFTALGLVIFAPLLGALGGLLLALSDTEVLADTDIIFLSLIHI